MSNATTLQQMPLGLISVAISLAALPRLSQFFAAREEDAYRRTLARGLRMVMLLIVPAAIGLWILGEPLVRLLFERNRFTSEDTYHVVQALNIYVLGMLFAAIDYPLNFAFYARNNTLLPALVGILSVGGYVVVAFATVDWLGYLGLVWADTAKQATHALIMSLLLLRYVGPLRAHMGRGLAMIGLGALGMAVVMLVISAVVQPLLPTGAIGDLSLLVTAGMGGVVAYTLLLLMLGLPEMRDVVNAAQVRFAR
jgi:putative peptidoglycan lipid II flippase